MIVGSRTEAIDRWQGIPILTSWWQGLGLIVSVSQHAMESRTRALSDGFKSMSCCLPMTAKGPQATFRRYDSNTANSLKRTFA